MPTDQVGNEPGRAGEGRGPEGKGGKGNEGSRGEWGELEESCFRVLRAAPPLPLPRGDRAEGGESLRRRGGSRVGQGSCARASVRTVRRSPCGRSLFVIADDDARGSLFFAFAFLFAVLDFGVPGVYPARHAPHVTKTVSTDAK